MPYLPKARRDLLDRTSIPRTIGDLIYLCTRAVLATGFGPLVEEELAADLERLTDAYLSGREPSSARHAEVLGAIATTKAEYCRRVDALDGWPRYAHQRWWALVAFGERFYARTAAALMDECAEREGDVYEGWVSSSTSHSVAAGAGDQQVTPGPSPRGNERSR
jgi:hypothetical protein